MANYTSVIASNICDASGNKLAAGTVSFQATDAANQPLNFQVGGGGQVVTTPATAAITAGAIAGGFQVADSANTSPAGILYRITVTDTTLNRVVVTYSLVTVTGATFNLDNYVATGASVLPPTGGSVVGPLTVTGNLSVTGSFNPGTLGNVISTGTILAKNIESIRYADQFPGADIGARINAAYADLPTGGGTIVVVPNPAGGSWQFSTPIVFTTANKPVLLIGTGVAGNNQNSAGVILEYTPTTATAAITLDYTNSTGSNTMAHGIRDLSLWNGHVFTVGGSGTSAVGVAIGAANGGAGQAEFSNVNFQGFNRGYDGSNGTSVGWGVVFRNCRFVYCASGLLPVAAENVTMFGGQFLDNGTGILGTTAEMSLFGVSFDGNTVVAVNWTGAASSQQVAFYGCHFENPGGTTANYVQGTANFAFYGGTMLNDTGTSNVNWYVSASGFWLYVNGLQIHSAGQTATQVFLLNAPVRAYLAPVNFSPTTLANIAGGANAPNATTVQTYANASNVNALWKIESQFKAPFGVGDAPFTPAQGFHIRVHGNATDALRLEDYDNAHIVDIGPGIGGGTLFQIRDITNGKAVLQYSFSTAAVTLPGALSLSGLISTYNGIATAGNGIPAVLGATSQRAESAADVNVLTVTPPASAGSYRIRFVLSVSAAVAATLGWTATWTDSNGNAQAPTNLSLYQTGVAAPALTFTTSAAGNYYGELQIDTNAAAANIVIKLTFSGTSFTAKASASIEKII